VCSTLVGLRLENSSLVGGKPQHGRKTMKKKSEFLGALGTMWQIWKSLTDEILSLGGDDEAIRLIETDSGLRRQIAELVMAKVCDAKTVAKQAILLYTVNSYEVVVDLSQNIEQMIYAGHYDREDSDIKQLRIIKGSLPGKRKIIVELLCFGQNFDNGEQVIDKLKEVNDLLLRRGAGYRYRFVQIEELLALGAAQPGLQRLFPIAALGSILEFTFGRGFACLRMIGLGRCLDMDKLGGNFSSDWCFAVVREPACR